MENFETDNLSIPFAMCYACNDNMPVEIYPLGLFSELDLDFHIGGTIVSNDELSKLQLVFCGKCGGLLNKSGPVKLEYYGESELRALGWKLAPQTTESGETE